MRTLITEAADTPTRRRRRAGPDPALHETYDPTVRLAAQCTWRQRMVNEHRSSAVFAALLPQLIEASARLDVQRAVLQAGMDEIHHAALCGEVVRAFGGDSRADAEPVLPTMPAHAGVSPLERVMRNVMFVGCLSETVAVALITAEREAIREPWIHDLMTTILADEVAHARLGWTFVPTALEALAGEARARTTEYLRTAFGYLEHHELDLLPRTPPFTASLRAQRKAAGLCDGDEARALFFDTIGTVIVPGLAALGLDAERAWRERVRISD